MHRDGRDTPITLLNSQGVALRSANRRDEDENQPMEDTAESGEEATSRDGFSEGSAFESFDHPEPSGVGTRKLWEDIEKGGGGSGRTGVRNGILFTGEAQSPGRQLL